MSPVPDDNDLDVTPKRLALRRGRAAAVVVLWLAMSLAAVMWLVTSDRSLAREAESATARMLPQADRPPASDLWLLLQVPEDRITPHSRSVLGQVGAMLGEQLDDVRLPIAPPASEIAMWLDEHLFYLLAPTTISELAAKLEPRAIAAAVAKIRAELASPLFGVLGGDVRRDPLQIHYLLHRTPGELGFIRPRGGPGSDGAQDPEVTVAGDLIAADGQSLLMKLRPTDDLDALEARAQHLVEQTGTDLRAQLVGPAVRQREADDASRSNRMGLVATVLAMLTLLLTVTLRAIRPVTCMIILMACAVGLLLAIEPRLGLLDMPLLILLLGFGCEGALHIHRISLRGWPSALILATALLPLWLTPHPLWHDWSLVWVLGLTLMLLAMRWVLPASLQLVGSELRWPQPAFHLRPMAGLAAVVTCCLLIGGAWAVERMPVEPGQRIALANPELAASEHHLERWFFDPDRVVWVQSRGETPADAISESFAAAHAMVANIGPVAARVESPGSLVVPESELSTRLEALKKVGLEARLQQLQATIADHGMRPAAFGEFLSGAGHLDQKPSPEAALEGPLGPWIESLMAVDETDPQTPHVVYTRLHLRPESPVPEDSNAPKNMQLHGPAVAASRVEASFESRLGLYSLCGLWLGALFVWFGTRQMSVAIAAGLAALAAQSGLLLMLHLLGVAASPLLIPVLLLVGATGVIAGGRACRSVDLNQSFSAGGFLVTSLCQLAAALTLMFSAQPLWREVGLMAACGSVLATGVGVFVAPGLCQMLRTLGRRLQERRS